MDLLVYLAGARDRVVSPDELLRGVWQGRVFDDGIVYNKINQLRKALGDDPQSPRFIATVPKRGYRLVADVALEGQDSSAGLSASAPPITVPRLPVATTAAAGGPASRRKRTPWPLVVAATATLLIGAVTAYVYYSLSRQASRQKYVAVLPCQNLGADPENAFALGVHGALIEQLAKADFEVTSRTDVMRYAAAQKPLSEIARELNVGAIMECSVQHAAGRVRVSVALADGATGRTPWRESYDEQLADVFTVESDIAVNVARALKVQLSPGQVAALQEVPSRSPRAIELYFSARGYEGRGVQSWPTAIAQYEKTVQEDPRYARAFAQLALLHLWNSGVTELPAAALEGAKAAAEKAVEVDPDLVQSQLAMIGYRFLRDRQNARQTLEQLNATEPKAKGLFEFYALRRDVNQAIGRHEDARRDADRAVALGPPNAVPLLNVQALSYMVLRRYAEAEKIFDHAADLAPDDFGTQYHRASLPLYRNGDTTAMRALEPVVLEGQIGPAFLIWAAAWMDGAATPEESQGTSARALFQSVVRWLDSLPRGRSRSRPTIDRRCAWPARKAYRSCAARGAARDQTGHIARAGLSRCDRGIEANDERGSRSVGLDTDGGCAGTTPGDRVQLCGCGCHGSCDRAARRLSLT